MKFFCLSFLDTAAEVSNISNIIWFWNSIWYSDQSYMDWEYEWYCLTNLKHPIFRLFPLSCLENDQYNIVGGTSFRRTWFYWGAPGPTSSFWWSPSTPSTTPGYATSVPTSGGLPCRRSSPSPRTATTKTSGDCSPTTPRATRCELHLLSVDP